MLLDLFFFVLDLPQRIARKIRNALIRLQSQERR
jgi:hypothetical protein